MRDQVSRCNQSWPHSMEEGFPKDSREWSHSRTTIVRMSAETCKIWKTRSRTTTSNQWLRDQIITTAIHTERLRYAECIARTVTVLCRRRLTMITSSNRRKFGDKFHWKRDILSAMMKWSLQENLIKKEEPLLASKTRDSMMRMSTSLTWDQPEANMDLKVS